MATIQLPIVFPDLEVSSLQAFEKGYILLAYFTTQQATCPSCKKISKRVYSYYMRHPADLPLSAMPVYLQLRVKRFRCTNPIVNKPLVNHTLIGYYLMIAEPLD